MHGERSKMRTYMEIGNLMNKGILRKYEKSIESLGTIILGKSGELIGKKPKRAFFLENFGEFPW